MEISELVRAIITLFVIIDPIGNVPIFLTLTAGMSAAMQRTVTFWAILFSFVILSLFVLVGEALLGAMGITSEAFKIAGGIFLFWTAFEMMYEKRQERREKTANRTPSNIELRALAASPLAIPLLAGPGTMTATIILTHEFEGIEGRAVLIGIIGGLMLFTATMFLIAIPLSRFMTETSRIVVTRVLGLILGALAVQIIIDGIKAVVLQT